MQVHGEMKQTRKLLLIVVEYIWYSHVCLGKVLWRNLIAFAVIPAAILILVSLKCCFVSSKADGTKLV